MKVPIPAIICLLAVISCSSCNSTDQTTLTTIGVTTVATGRAPSHEIEQVYYIGVFDPDEQVPPSLYRITLRGQASFISNVNFASGWVPAWAADSLGTNLSLDPQSGKLNFGQNKDLTVSLKTGRRLIQYGPEGFREVPADHRLVVLMSSSPSKYFEAIGNVTSKVSKTVLAAQKGPLKNEVLKLLLGVGDAKDVIAGLQEGIAANSSKTDSQ